MAPMKPKFLRLTEELNALDDFEKAVFFIRETQHSDMAWKWVVLSLHGALYGFAISACQGTCADSVLDGTRLISFGEAIKRCKACRPGKPLVLSSAERKSIDALKKSLRNNLEHFRPRHWSIELHGFPTMAMNCIRVIETLATATSRSVKLDKTQRQHVLELAAEARTLLLNSSLYLDLQPTPSRSTRVANGVGRTKLPT